MEALATEWENKCSERWEQGAKDYGPENFLNVDLVEFITEELTDIANYAFMTFVRLKLLQEQAYERGIDLSLGLDSGVRELEQVPPNPSAFVGQQEVYGILSEEDIGR